MINAWITKISENNPDTAEACIEDVNPVEFISQMNADKGVWLGKEFFIPLSNIAEVWFDDRDNVQP